MNYYSGYVDNGELLQTLRENILKSGYIITHPDDPADGINHVYIYLTDHQSPPNADEKVDRELQELEKELDEIGKSPNADEKVDRELQELEKELDADEKVVDEIGKPPPPLETSTLSFLSDAPEPPTEVFTNPKTTPPFSPIATVDDKDDEKGDTILSFLRNDVERLNDDPWPVFSGQQEQTPRRGG